jgi:zinc protease
LLAIFILLAHSPGLSRSADTSASDPSTAIEKLVTIEGITEYRLKNGLRVLLFPDPSTQNVTVNLTVFVGSRHEGYGETGMAHLLEHMVFKGTPQHPDVPRALKEHGAQFNGTTWVDRTNYFETMTGTDANLEFGIRLEADRMVNSFIRREDLVSEMTVVRSEFEMGENSPEYVLRQRMMGAAYEWHNYGKSTIGNRSDIERVPIDRLQAFYRKYYQPDNAMLVVAGKFDTAKALAYIGKYFVPLKRPARVLDTTYTEEPAQDGERQVVLRRVGKVGVVGAVYHIPAGPHEDFPAVEVLATILGSEPGGRLYKALVATKKATSVSANAFRWHDPGVLEVMAQVDLHTSLAEAQDALLRVLEPSELKPFTEDEVNRAKQELLTERDLLMTKSNSIGRVLTEWGALGDWRLFFLHRDRLAKVTPADVTRVAHQYLQATNRTLGLFQPTDRPMRAAIPSTPSVESLVKNYRGSQTIAQGQEFDPSPVNVERHVQRSELVGGLKLALLPKKTRGQAVVARLVLHYGNEESLRGHTSATQFLAQLMERGTRKHTYQQIQDELNRLGARLQTGGLLGDASFTVETRRESFPAVLRLLAEVVREPVFPEEEFDIIKRELRDELEKSRPEPNALAFREIQRQLNPYPPEDVRYVPTVEDSINRLQAVNVEEVRHLYAEQMGAQSGELAVVGDFDPDAVRKLTEELLGDWKAATPYRRISRPANTELAGKRSVILTPDKANAVYVAGQNLALSDTDPDYPALEIANFLFGGGTLSSRLGNRVRQKEGLSYGVRSMFSADARDKAARFLIFAICNPVNIDKVDKAIQEELSKLLKQGVDAKEVTEAKKAYLEMEKVMRAADNRLVGILADDLYNGRTLGYYADLEKKIQALDPEQVMAAVRKHLEPKKLRIIEAGDFAKKKGEAGGG